MKKLFTAILTVVALAIATPSHAQFGFGLRGGLNITNLTFSENDLKSSNKAGFFIGPTVKFTAPIIGLGFDAAVLYDQRSSKISDVSVKEQNIVLPINLRYQLGLGNLAALVLKAGPQFAWNVGDKKYSMGNIVTGITQDFKLKNSNVSLNLGVGAFLLNHLEAGLTYNIALGKTGEISYLDAAGTLVNSAANSALQAAGLKEQKTKTNAWQIYVAYYF